MGFSGSGNQSFQSWIPADNNLLGATYDPILAESQTIGIAGTLYLLKLPVRTSTLITNILFLLSASGVGASTGSFAGLYSSTGVLLSGSSDIGGLLLSSAGGVTCPLTTPQSVSGGAESAWPWAALLFNLATTQPTLGRANPTAALTNIGLIAANYRVAVNGTGLLTLPGSIVPSSNTLAGAIGAWAGWS